MTHVIILLIVFILPEIIFSAAFEHRPMSNRHIEVYFHTTLYIAVFYINYFILIEKLLFRKKTVAYIVVTLLFSFGIVLIMMFSHPIISAIFGDDRNALRPPKFDDGKIFVLGRMVRDFTMTILTIGLSIAVKLSLRWNKIENMKKQIIADQRETELSNLKNQLNPHFLFNTLNNIYALISIDSDKAQTAVHQLSKMLRYTLYENEKEVDLDKELQFMRNYIELMKLRLSKNNKLTVDIYDKPTNGLKIAPLLFISLVENAFKYGVRGSEDSKISISITLEESTVCCHIENSYFPQNIPESNSSGIGMTNLKRRLSLLYNDNYSLTSSVVDNSYIAELTINLTNTNDNE